MYQHLRQTHTSDRVIPTHASLINRRCRAEARLRGNGSRELLLIIGSGATSEQNKNTEFNPVGPRRAAGPVGRWPPARPDPRTRLYILRQPFLSLSPRTETLLPSPPRNLLFCSLFRQPSPCLRFYALHSPP